MLSKRGGGEEENKTTNQTKKDTADERRAVVGISQKIYGHTINEPMEITQGVLDHAQLQRPFEDRDTFWRIALYPKLPSFSIAWWIELGIRPDNITARLSRMEPGDELPKLMNRLRLFEPM